MRTGSIFRRKADKRWIAQVSSGSRSDRTVRRRVARTRAAAEELLVELRADAGIVDPRVTTGEYLRGWLVTAGRSVKPSTLQTYEIAVRLQLLPSLAAIRLSQLGPAHVEALMRNLDASMQPKGARNVLGVLSRALTVAERQGLVRRNVARLVDPPRVERVELPALRPEDVRKILAAVAGDPAADPPVPRDRLEALYVLALATGLRQAELLGLRWEDVDRDAGTIHVQYALERQAGRYELVEPKTRRSRRTIALPAFAVDALGRHRTAQLAERLAAGVETEDGLVFVTPSGRPVNGGWLSHHWPKIAKAAGVTVTFHGLRHGQASLLVALGVHPRVIAERLGHATVAMAMDRYAHVGAESDREAARLLDAAVSAG